MERRAEVSRQTSETRISLSLVIDGTGETEVKTGLPFLDHMLIGFARHGFFNLRFLAEGDLQVDAHHVMEDAGIVLGQGVREALGDKAGLKRFGAALIPMDDALAQVALDLSGRSYLSYDLKGVEMLQVGHLNVRLFRDFFQGLVNTAGMNLHVELLAGDEPHHAMEAVFKALGRALDAAVRSDQRVQDVPSSKGVLD